ncbi:hypothetical protein HY416_01905 [Candidatus Kaiserbacteria bacterium]|nr:hypothetical protein [Candidatus Kaiserbacteria bacterium]
MNILLAVVEDLYTFAVSVLFRRQGQVGNSNDTLYLPPSRVVSAVRETTDIDSYRHTSPVPMAEPVPVAPATAPSMAAPQKHTLVYCAKSRVPLRTTPDGASDTTIAMIPYGEMLMLLAADDAYAHVALGDKRGYVPSTAIVQKAADVYPTFMIGEENGAHDINTVRLRSVIDDEFSAGLTQLPLGAHEYVYYRLLRRGVHLAWPDIRPRTPGAWAKILSTVSSAKIGDEPSVGSVMEFVLSDEKAHLAYVDKVFNDSIQISEADWPSHGIYNERVLVEAEWKALAPSFIAVS